MGTQDLKFTDCTNFLGQDYPFLTTEMYVECFNGDKGLIEWTDGHRFKIYGNIMSKMDIKRFAIIKSDREKAIEWWNKKLSGFDRTRIGSKHFDFRRLSSLTGREIEQIWRKETQQFSVTEQGGLNIKYPFVKKKGSEEVQQINSEVYQEPKEGFDEDRVFQHELQTKIKKNSGEEVQPNFNECLLTQLQYKEPLKNQILNKDRNHAVIDGEIVIVGQERPKVDFEMLKLFKEDFKNLSNLNPVLKGGWIKESLENMYLFIELLSKSSTFAHKAHKELNKLSNK